jgi:hypothetical protein
MMRKAVDAGLSRTLPVSRGGVNQIAVYLIFVQRVGRDQPPSPTPRAGYAFGSPAFDYPAYSSCGLSTITPPGRGRSVATSGG